MTDVDFTFAFEGAAGPRGPWRHLEVVSFKGHEELSALGRYELTLLARVPAPEVDPSEMVGRSASFRVRTGTDPEHHVVHGIIAEIEELEGLPDGMLYRVVLTPPLARARYRRRCRIFLEKTTRQIIDAVLQGDPKLGKADGAAAPPDDGNSGLFTPAVELYTWRITQSPRIDEPSARPFCVQYNESDLAFVSRLLEEEGIAYHYENGAETCLLVLSDHDAGRTPAGAPIGPGIQGRELVTLRLGGRLRAKGASLDDYDWHKPALGMIARSGGGDLAEYSYPGGYGDAPSQGEPLARAIVERYAIEASYAAGEGTVRSLFAGALVTAVYPKPNHEGDYLVTRLEVRGEGGGMSARSLIQTEGVPFRCRFEAARRRGGESRFRPARVTPKPRIVGSQTAFVTCTPEAPGATVHVGDRIGCVRLRFHWDHQDERLAREPSSCWVRVSQMFAGAGEGAVWHPRVGVEVVVEFLEGDPDRPLVTGRVYNGAKTPPAPSVGSPTISTWKTFSIPGGAQYNELLFDDAAGSERIQMHAAKDWISIVEHDRTELVKIDSLSTVGVGRTEATGASRVTTVAADNSETVGENESVGVGANQSVSVSVNQTVSVGNNQTTTIGGWQNVGIAGDQSIQVGGNQTLRVSRDQNFHVQGDIRYDSAQTLRLVSSLGQSFADGESQTLEAPTQTFTAASAGVGRGDGWQRFTSLGFNVEASDAATIHGVNKGVYIASEVGEVKIDGQKLLHMESPTLVEVVGKQVQATSENGMTLTDVSSGGTLSLSGTAISLGGASSVAVQGKASVTVTAGSTISLNAGVIKLNG